MIHCEQKTNPSEPFRALVAGDTFTINGTEVFLKRDPIEEGVRCNAISLTNGHLMLFGEETKVCPIEVEIRWSVRR